MPARPSTCGGKATGTSARRTHRPPSPRPRSPHRLHLRRVRLLRHRRRVHRANAVHHLTGGEYDERTPFTISGARLGAPDVVTYDAPVHAMPKPMPMPPAPSRYRRLRPARRQKTERNHDTGGCVPRDSFFAKVRTPPCLLVELAPATPSLACASLKRRAGRGRRAPGHSPECRSPAARRPPRAPEDSLLPDGHVRRVARRLRAPLCALAASSVAATDVVDPGPARPR